MIAREYEHLTLLPLGMRSISYKANERFKCVIIIHIKKPSGGILADPDGFFTDSLQ